MSKTKRIIATAVAFVVVLTSVLVLLPIMEARAADPQTKNVGTNCLATYNSDTYTISVTKINSAQDATIGWSAIRGLIKDDFTEAKALEIKDQIIYNGDHLNQLFYDLKKIEKIDLSGLVVSNITSAYAMFDNCKALSDLTLPTMDTSQITKMYNMFASCESLTSLDLSGFDTSAVTDMDNMFYNCCNLTSLNVSGFNTANVTSMAGMFWLCSKLTTLDISTFNTSKVTDMHNMFYYCTELVTIKASKRFVTTYENLNSKDMFTGCTVLTGGAGTQIDKDHVNKSGACIDRMTGSEWGVDVGYFTEVIIKHDITFPVNQTEYTIYKADGTTAVQATENDWEEGTAFIVKPNSGYYFADSSWDEAVTVSTAGAADLTSEASGDTDRKFTVARIDKDCQVAVSNASFSTIASYKETKKTELEAVRADAETYIRGLGLSESAVATALTNLGTMFNSGIASIDAKTTIKDIDKAYDDAVYDITNLKKNNFDAYKNQKAAELQSYGTDTTNAIRALNLSQAETMSLTMEVSQASTTGQTTIINATDKAAVDSAVQTAKNSIDQVKAKGDLSAYKASKEAALATDAENAKASVTGMEIPADSKTAFCAQIDTQAENGKTAIAAAADKAAADAAYDAAKNEIDKITQAAPAAFTEYQNKKTEELKKVQADTEAAIKAANMPDVAKDTLIELADNAAKAGETAIKASTTIAAVDSAYSTAKGILDEIAADANAFKTYKFLEGADSKWEQKQSGTVTMRVEAQFNLFLKAFVDGKELSKNDYSLTEGSTIVTFTNSYLNSLSVGSHQVTFVWKNGYTNTTLTVTAAAPATSETTKATATTKAS
ncbi:MAG: BspA family leucine-rich repeat surface protein, partial [Parasporobacterium sp.]|nr:BspA family leucine-rich repeat surface protein [Parasporobacterium sp.]